MRQAAIAGIGQSEYGRFLPESQLKLGARALKAALEDAGLEREDVDGIAIHLGWPLGVDYDRAAEAYGLDLRWVSQSWLHGRFITSAIQQAAMAVASRAARISSAGKRWRARAAAASRASGDPAGRRTILTRPPRSFL